LLLLKFQAKYLWDVALLSFAVSVGDYDYDYQIIYRFLFCLLSMEYNLLSMVMLYIHKVTLTQKTSLYYIDVFVK